MSINVVPFDPDATCENCGGRGAFDFMGDDICPSCLQICKGCQELFMIDPKRPKAEQQYCAECHR